MMRHTLTGRRRAPVTVFIAGRAVQIARTGYRLEKGDFTTMKRSLFRLMGTSLLLGALAVPAFCGAKGVHWVSGYEAGMAEAKAQHKIAVMDFYTENCGWCHEMDKKTFTDKSVIKMSANFVMVKVNAMNDRTAMIRHEVRGF